MQNRQVNNNIPPRIQAADVNEANNINQPAEGVQAVANTEESIVTSNGGIFAAATLATMLTVGFGFAAFFALSTMPIIPIVLGALALASIITVVGLMIARSLGDYCCKQAPDPTPDIFISQPPRPEEYELDTRPHTQPDGRGQPGRDNYGYDDAGFDRRQPVDRDESGRDYRREGIYVPAGRNLYLDEGRRDPQAERESQPNLPPFSLPPVSYDLDSIDSGSLGSGSFGAGSFGSETIDGDLELPEFSQEFPLGPFIQTPLHPVPQRPFQRIQPPFVDPYGENGGARGINPYAENVGQRGVNPYGENGGARGVNPYGENGGARGVNPYGEGRRPREPYPYDEDRRPRGVNPYGEDRGARGVNPYGEDRRGPGRVNPYAEDEGQRGVNPYGEDRRGLGRVNPYAEDRGARGRGVNPYGDDRRDLAPAADEGNYATIQRRPSPPRRPRLTTFQNPAPENGPPRRREGIFVAPPQAPEEFPGGVKLPKVSPETLTRTKSQLGAGEGRRPLLRNLLDKDSKQPAPPVPPAQAREPQRPQPPQRGQIRARADVPPPQPPVAPPLPPAQQRDSHIQERRDVPPAPPPPPVAVPPVAPRQPGRDNIRERRDVNPLPAPPPQPNSQIRDRLDVPAAPPQAPKPAIRRAQSKIVLSGPFAAKPEGAQAGAPRPQARADERIPPAPSTPPPPPPATPPRSAPLRRAQSRINLSDRRLPEPPMHQPRARLDVPPDNNSEQPGNQNNNRLPRPDGNGPRPDFLTELQGIIQNKK